MTLRHTVTLAVIGWYLLMPQVSDKGAVLSDWPLSRWKLDSSYDSAEKCENNRRIATDFVTKEGLVKQGVSAQILDGVYAAYHNAICVSTDDPRLKGN